MYIIKTIYLSLLILLSFTANASTLQTCTKLGGVMVNELKCPKSKKNRTGKFCVLSGKPLVYFNGCTGGFGKYSDTFFKACLKHDFCYHHEPATNNLSKKTCDEKFFNNMTLVCNAENNRLKYFTCLGAAWSFYQAVKVGGKKSWECSDSKFDYSDLDKILNSLK